MTNSPNVGTEAPWDGDKCHDPKCYRPERHKTHSPAEGVIVCGHGREGLCGADCPRHGCPAPTCDVPPFLEAQGVRLHVNSDGFVFERCVNPETCPYEPDSRVHRTFFSRSAVEQAVREELNDLAHWLSDQKIVVEALNAEDKAYHVGLQTAIDEAHRRARGGREGK